MNIIDDINKEQMKEIPVFSPGDDIVVQVRVKEGQRERLQAFEGVVISVKNRGINSSFTVRKISHLRELSGKAARIKEKLSSK